MKIYKFVLCFVCIFLSLPSFSNITTPISIHIFFENIGTTPALGGMLHYVDLPKSDVKIIGWHRFPRPDEQQLQGLNTYWIDVPKNEMFYKRGKNVFINAIKEIIKKHPNSPLYVYTGIYQVSLITDLAENFPENEIKHVHLYEDGVFNWRVAPLQRFIFDPYPIKKIIGARQNKTLDEIKNIPLGDFIPITYHIAGFNQLSQNKENVFQRFCSEQKLNGIDFDIWKLREQLTEEQKLLLFCLSGFEYEKLKFLKDKKFFLFSAGHVHKDIKIRWKQTPENMMLILKKARAGVYGSIPEDIIWVYKLHPSLGITDLSPYIRNEFPDMIEIPSWIPYELLIIAGIDPEQLVVSGSSFVFWINNDKILKYISQPLYDAALKEAQIISDEKMIYPHVAEQGESEQNNLFLMYSNNREILIPTYIDNYFCKKNDVYTCAFVTHQSDNCVEIEWDNKNKEIFCRQINQKEYEQKK